MLRTNFDIYLLFAVIFLGWYKDFKGIVQHFGKYTHLLYYSELDLKIGTTVMPVGRRIGYEAITLSQLA